MVPAGTAAGTVCIITRKYYDMCERRVVPPKLINSPRHLCFIHINSYHSHQRNYCTNNNYHSATVVIHNNDNATFE